MTPWLSIVVPTDGKRRDGLLRTIESIRRQPRTTRDGVEVLVVADVYEADRGALDVLQGELFGCRVNYRWLEHDAGVHCYGQPQRQYGALHARGEWVGFSQDDNILSADALGNIWMAVCSEPRKRPLFFRVLTYWRQTIWGVPLLQQSNIDADCLVFPRTLAQQVQWGLRYEGDFDAAVHAMQLAQGDIGWREESIAIARPDAEHLWW
jgi:hypothetical protein